MSAKGIKKEGMFGSFWGKQSQKSEAEFGFQNTPSLNGSSEIDDPERGPAEMGAPVGAPSPLPSPTSQASPSGRLGRVGSFFGSARTGGSVASPSPSSRNADSSRNLRNGNAGRWWMFSHRRGWNCGTRV
mmetsp:Transcript_23263/g.52160  ORF Transcript_23263/g.52160 Transcript_23263/m.52160 type:complete len:130 (+) Transcript_23263:198-587(+)